LSAWEIGRFRIRQPGLLELACRMVELQLIQRAELLSQNRPDGRPSIRGQRTKKAPV
jgi:hypothetical protein